MRNRIMSYQYFKEKRTSSGGVMSISSDGWPKKSAALIDLFAFVQSKINAQRVLKTNRRERRDCRVRGRQEPLLGRPPEVCGIKNGCPPL